jgi:hypothetical protein
MLVICMETLPDDIQGVLLQNLDQMSLIELCEVNKYYHKLVSSYGKNNKTERIMINAFIAIYGYAKIEEFA